MIMMIIMMDTMVTLMPSADDYNDGDYGGSRCSSLPLPVLLLVFFSRAVFLLFFFSAVFLLVFFFSGSIPPSLVCVVKVVDLAMKMTTTMTITMMVVASTYDYDNFDYDDGDDDFVHWKI